MVNNKNELKYFLKIEKNIYMNLGYKNRIVSFFNQSEIGKIYKYVKLLRYDEYFSNIHSVVRFFIRRKRNKLGLELGINIPINTCDIGVIIYHANGIVINSNAKIGKNCKIHGDVCIGNDGNDKNGVPQLGDNVDIGVGAKIIGNVKISNNTKIGANAVVLKGIYASNAILVGIPAKDKNNG